MRPWKYVLAAGVILGLVTGCSNRRVIAPEPQFKIIDPIPVSREPDLVVLLPDPDGKVGVVQVTTKGGSQVLYKAGYGTMIEDDQKPPSVPRPITENEIKGIFGEALSAQPDLKDRFGSFTLWFENGSTELTAPSKKMLPEILGLIKERKSRAIYVIGHTDRVGTDAFNLKLSSQRANRIRDLLVLKGIKGKEIMVSSYGEAKPLVYTEDEVAEPLNRRVEVLVR